MLQMNILLNATRFVIEKFIWALIGRDCFLLVGLSDERIDIPIW